MTGKTHKAIGVVTGVAFTLYAVKTEQPMYALGMITAPLGAMLPDADHDMSKLGANRKKVINMIKTAVTASLILGSLLFWLLEGRTLEAALKVALILVPCGVAVLITTNQKFKEKIKFFTKHRGIMHTLVVPATMVIGSVFLKNEYAQALLLGLSLGYVSHLMADTLTKAGCPLVWPISEDPIRLTTVTTGTIWEYVTAACLAVFILWYGDHLSDYPGDIAWMAVFLSLGVGQVIPNILNRLGKKVKKFSHNLLIPAALVILSYFLLNGVIQMLIFGLSAGFVSHVVSDMAKGEGKKK